MERLLELLILFGWSFASATILPLSSEVPLGLAVRRSGDWVLPVIVATAGNYLGACTTYLLARYVTDHAVTRPSRRTAQASALIARYGPPALLLSWVPLIGDVLVVLAGIAHMPFVSFTVWTLVGKAARYVAIGWLFDGATG